jgi:hypothetical protein
MNKKSGYSFICVHILNGKEVTLEEVIEHIAQRQAEKEAELLKQSAKAK